jgi:hypothetical protein
MESNLSRTIAGYLDDLTQSDGPWANAWKPVWEQPSEQPVAVAQQWVDASAARAAATFTPANAPAVEKEEKLHA